MLKEQNKKQNHKNNLFKLKHFCLYFLIYTINKYTIYSSPSFTKLDLRRPSLKSETPNYRKDIKHELL